MAKAVRYRMADLRVSQSAVTSLKAIFSVLMGLSVTNTLVVLIRDGGGSSVLALGAVGADPLPAVFAAALLFTIARFYLGNVRHVDDFYISRMVDGMPIDPSANSAARFIADFAVLLIEALMFGLASFYVGHAADFTEILMALLVIDITWTVASRGVAPHQRFWFFNNLGHLLAIAICFGFHLQYPGSELPFYFAIGLLLTNGAADLTGNRAFYFADWQQKKAVFLSAPFTQLLIEDNLPKAFRERLSTIMDHLEAEGWSVYNAHKRERWGTTLDSPLTALRADLEGIEEADVLVAILGSPPSPGVQLEIGFALARGKKIVLVADTENGDLPYLIHGVIEQDSTVLVSKADTQKGNHEFSEAISDALVRLAT